MENGLSTFWSEMQPISADSNHSSPLRTVPLSMAATANTLSESFYVDLVTEADMDDEAAEFFKRGTTADALRGYEFPQMDDKLLGAINLLEGQDRSTSQNIIVLHKASVKVLVIA